MKRLQILVPDSLYGQLVKEAARQEWTVSELVRRGIEKQLAQSVEEPPRPFRIKSFDMGGAKIPEEQWRDHIYDHITE